MIPTFQRPELVTRAVRSALAQTLIGIEVIVVVDGGDRKTVQMLGRISDPRLRVIVPPKHLGNAGARNLAVAQARAAWIAFLDDDDVWMPQKLEWQLRVARASSFPYPVVSCRLIVRSEAHEQVWPRRFPHPQEPVNEYLFCRKTPFTGEGAIITSAILTCRQLLQQLPFDEALPRLVDVDWLLRADQTEGVGVEFVTAQEPLLVWNAEQNRVRITNSRDWMYSLNYARRHRQLFTHRGYAAFVLHVVSSDAAVQKRWGAVIPLLWEAFRNGHPALIDILSHLANFGVPDQVRRSLVARFARWSYSTSPLTST